MTAPWHKGRNQLAGTTYVFAIIRNAAALPEPSISGHWIESAVKDLEITASCRATNDA
ncbi:hypothetical protein J2W42_005112 [Rhizobium tibeticum]|uniref:Uncharacterized protein n=1 Tax=Rhizobium tibeticum TaxID=501024 RepID=A0A1H8SB61_9HYPH|nr:hypothetical protein [Rhizobium tibeticum]SEI12129.1 hypothetical protein RTCCBAU85039_4758 [Rhizobium tibeticum]SEO75901.1 hypothetical protein SAMN05216228_102421 [Rhizobium tibeticum]